MNCRTRLSTPGGRAEVVDDLCPGCGSPLEPVVELAELVGFRAISARERARLDAERWILDEDPAIAQALPRPDTPTRS
jgi:hypothetical protein